MSIPLTALNVLVYVAIGAFGGIVGITPIDVTNTAYTDHAQKWGEANRK